MDIDLTPKLRQKMQARPRVRGRYNASELYFINEGKTTPEEWLFSRERSAEEILRMWNGIGVHNQIESLLDQKHTEIKTTYDFEDITLVGVADYLSKTKDEVWDFKTSEKQLSKSKPWHDYQLRLYCTMFGRKEGVIYQPLQDKNGLYLKELGRVVRDDEWVQQELEKLYEFHKQVERLWIKRESGKIM